MNAQIDRSTQTVQLFVEVRSNDLNEGEYLEADIEAKNIENVFEINRNLIVDQNSVYVVKENSLAKQQITIVHTNENSIVVSGLVDSTELVTSPVSGAYEGMNIVVKN